MKVYRESEATSPDRRRLRSGQRFCENMANRFGVSPTQAVLGVYSFVENQRSDSTVGNSPGERSHRGNPSAYLTMAVTAGKLPNEFGPTLARPQPTGNDTDPQAGLGRKGVLRKPRLNERIFARLVVLCWSTASENGPINPLAARFGLLVLPVAGTTPVNPRCEVRRDLLLQPVVRFEHSSRNAELRFSTMTLFVAGVHNTGRATRSMFFLISRVPRNRIRRDLQTDDVVRCRR